MLTERVLQSREGRLDANEHRLLEKAILRVDEFPARVTVTQAGVRLQHSMLLIDGFMSRYADDKNGDRQLVATHIPGDFLDLHAYPLKSLDHHVGTISASRVAIFPHARLDDILEHHPVLARKLWFSTLLDAAMHRKWVFRLGRLKSHARVAHFLCETNARLIAVGLSDGSTFRLPLKQFDLADICGLTTVHVNRVMRELRAKRLCTFRSSIAEIHDLPALMRLGEFDPGYLYLDGCAGVSASFERAMA